MVTYYEIAIEDLRYLMHAAKFPLYNNTVILAQQVAEKLLKSVAEQIIAQDAEKILKSHNLRVLAERIDENLPDCEKFNLDSRDMVFLRDFYFEAKYPGDNYIAVSRTECQVALNIMHNVVDKVNTFRRTHHFEIVENLRVTLGDESTNFFSED